VLAVNVVALVTEAQRADCIIEVAAQVGDFVAVDEPLFYLYGKQVKSTIAASGSLWRLAGSGPWSRTRCLRFASWSISL